MSAVTNKLRGGYYTPTEVAHFICAWAITDKSTTVLEPSCGDGVFINAAYRRLLDLGSTKPENQITGVELYPKEAKKAASKGGQILHGDFFTQYRKKLGTERYKAIVGNPPFIRYQDFENEFRTIAFDIMHEYGFSPNRLTNIWLPFLVICCHLLTDEGRLGMVIPAELFQVKYAAETRRFLLDYFSNITVITFSDLLFHDAQQEVVLLLAERSTKKKEQGIRVVEETDSVSLSKLAPTKLATVPLKHRLPDSMKWQGYFLENKVLDLISELADDTRVRVSGDLFNVNVGVVSGNNSYFVINQETATSHGIAESCVPIVSRSFQLDGLAFTEEDFMHQLRKQRKVLLFLPGNKLNKHEKEYVAHGEATEVNNGFKCRIRAPWYKVRPSWKPDAFFYRQVGAFPRIVVNTEMAYTTDTLHKVQFAPGIDGKAVSVAFNNSLTFAVSELTGRSYGGGVLTFEPSEARNLLIPFIDSVEFDFEKADSLIRKGEEELLIRYVNDILLVKGLGLAKADVSLLHDAWLSLRNRRLARKKK